LILNYNKREERLTCTIDIFGSNKKGKEGNIKIRKLGNEGNMKGERGELMVKGGMST
jgi:hypothetical protein